jgi:beta-galactosidase GanA
VVARTGSDGVRYLFVLNHRAEAVTCDLPQPMADLLKGGEPGASLTLEPYGVAVLTV